MRDLPPISNNLFFSFKFKLISILRNNKKKTKKWFKIINNIINKINK